MIPAPSFRLLGKAPSDENEGGQQMTTTTKSGITTIGLVVVPVADQDRSIGFYESIGFEKRTDIGFGDKYRWVEVYPPSGSTGIALAPPRPGEELQAKDTGISLQSEDVDATRSYMQSQGVDVDAEVARLGDPVPPMFWFRDPDGHSLLVVQAS
jgi:catechol 2,3-dioxygenase-like lactoylglutathione lyase family enzyme